MSTSRRLVAALVVVGLLALGGAAWAYFKSSGSGHGHGSTGTMSPIVLQAVAGKPSMPLYPGNTGGDVVLTVENPNSYPVTLVSVALKSGGTIMPDANHSSTCTTTGVTFTNWTGSVPITAVNGNTQNIDLASSASMSTSSSNACQGATFSIPVTITVEK